MNKVILKVGILASFFFHDHRVKLSVPGIGSYTVYSTNITQGHPPTPFKWLDEYRLRAFYDPFPFRGDFNDPYLWYDFYDEGYNGSHWE